MMLLHFAVFITDFADGGVMVPLALCIGITFLLLRRPKLARAWATAVGGVWAAMFVLKLAGYTFENLLPMSLPTELGLVTPSGHVASAAAVFGALAGLLLKRPLSAVQRSFVVAIATAVLIGTTRVALGDHTFGEVVVGGMVGVAGAVALPALARVTLGGTPRTVILGVTALVIVACHGTHLTWESSIRSASSQAVSGWSNYVMHSR